MERYVAYFRVSTDKQGRSGLGIEAQQAAVESFVATKAGCIIGNYTEVESGRKSDRHILGQAVQRARSLGATLLIAKLDRLARDVQFISTLMNSDVRFVACDMPNADRFTIHILAAVAEQEARSTSERTRAALQSAKARGTVLGGFRGVAPDGSARLKSAAVRGRQARQRAATVLPIIEDIRRQGVRSLGGIAIELTRRGIETPRGMTSWSATQVSRAICR